MREDPNSRTSLYEQIYSGDNFVKITGREYEDFREIQILMSNVKCNGNNNLTDLVPSQVETLLRLRTTEKKINNSKQRMILKSKYHNHTHDLKKPEFPGYQKQIT